MTAQNERWTMRPGEVRVYERGHYTRGHYTIVSCCSQEHADYNVFFRGNRIRSMVSLRRAKIICKEHERRLGVSVDELEKDGS